MLQMNCSIVLTFELLFVLQASKRLFPRGLKDAQNDLLGLRKQPSDLFLQEPRLARAGLRFQDKSLFRLVVQNVQLLLGPKMFFVVSCLSRVLSCQSSLG